jgi:electron transport complex protein RnfD
MLDVLIALAPASLCAVIFFGPMSLAYILVSCASCFAAELIYGIIKGRHYTTLDNLKEGLKKSTVWDCSCLVTGLLLALSLPLTLPLYLVPAAAAFGIIIVKMLFGGIGKNFLNPALMGRIFLIIAFTSMMGQTMINNFPMAEDVAGATWLGAGRPGEGFNLLAMFLGNTGASGIGETSFLALLFGYAYLSYRKVIDFKLPLIIIGGVMVFAFLFDCLIGPRAIGEWGYALAAHAMSGSLMLGAVFMATDYATSPNTQLGMLIYGLGISFITVIIRVFGALPEGIAFAIVIMNIVSVILDRYIRPQFFGRMKNPRTIGPKSDKGANQ